jgi:hypothetical protein
LFNILKDSLIEKNEHYLKFFESSYSTPPLIASSLNPSMNSPIDHSMIPPPINPMQSK